MLPPKPLSREQQRLLALFGRLGPGDREKLFSYAEFLLAQATGEVPNGGQGVAAEPVSIPRPEEESVVAAIRRLSETFPMLDRDLLLHETAELMTAHVVQGRPAVEVIDELEVVFRRHYERVESPKE